EAHRQIPERRDEQPLERDTAEHGGRREHHAAGKGPYDEPGGAEAEEEAEQKARRRQRPKGPARCGASTRRERMRIRRTMRGVGMAAVGAMRVQMHVSVAGVTACTVASGRMTSRPETAECHDAEAGGTEQETRDVEVHRGVRGKERATTSPIQRISGREVPRADHPPVRLGVT